MASLSISKIIVSSFKVSSYTKKPFRVIGLIEVEIYFKNEKEKVTIPFFRSSGTNGGKIKGMWYPIVGIKEYTGSFTEFTNTVNNILRESTRNAVVKKGWLAKSIFFTNYLGYDMINGFSYGQYYDAIYKIGKILRELYESGSYTECKLSIEEYNNIIYSNKIYYGNRYSQRDNFNSYIYSIYMDR